MKTISKIAAQGDMLIIKTDSVPDGYEPQPAQDGQLVLAHSETGHNHTAPASAAELLASGQDPMVCYLKVTGEYADITHHRSFDTHETLRVPKGTYRINRQREYRPEGWRRVED